MLGGSVLRLGQLSLGISEEIDSQNILLNRLEGDVETAHENVNLLTKTTQAMVKKAGGSKNFCIILALTILLLFLIFLIIYT
jgi:syntaxin 6